MVEQIDPPDECARMWLNVLTMAIKDLRLTYQRHTSVAFLTSPWFLDVCDMAGLSPEYVKQLFRMIGTYVEIKNPEMIEKGANYYGFEAISSDDK